MLLELMYQLAQNTDRLLDDLTLSDSGQVFFESNSTAVTFTWV